MPALPKAALLAALAAFPLAAQEAPVPPVGPPVGPRVIQVTGEGATTAAPDLARVSLGVAQQAETAGAALAAMGAGVTAVLARLAEQGIAPADIQTGQLLLEPVYDYNASYVGTPPLLGYLATQILDVRVRDASRVGPVLDAVVADGANRVNGISFELSEPGAALDEARRAAVADARARAAVFAEAAGVALGDLVSISEAGPFAPPVPFFAARDEAEAASVPVAPGEVQVGVVATVTFAIE